MSECGAYKWTGDPFKMTGEKSNKIFSMALGNIAPGQDIVNLPLPLRDKATRSHTVSGLQNNLLSMNTGVREGYIPIFKGD